MKLNARTNDPREFARAAKAIIYLDDVEQFHVIEACDETNTLTKYMLHADWFVIDYDRFRTETLTGCVKIVIPGEYETPD